MGQCKSKVAVLDDSNHRNINESGGVLKFKPKKTKRKWKKSKGYSLSASVEGELNCDIDTHSLSKGTPKNGPVLVSYNVKNDENKKFNPGRRNSYHPASPPNEFAIEESSDVNCDNVTRMYKEDPIQLRHAQPPIAEPESDLSNFSSPVKTADTSNAFSMTADPYITQVSCTTPRPNQIKTLAEIVIVPEPTICLEASELGGLEEVIPASQNNFLHFSSIDNKSENSSVSTRNTSFSPHQCETIAAGPILASSGLTLPDRIPNDSPPLLEVKDVSPAVFNPLVSINGSNVCAAFDAEEFVGTDETATDLHSDRSQGTASLPLKKSSVIVSNNQHRVSVPVPSNISAILQTGLAPISFIDKIASSKSSEMGNKNSIKCSDLETEEEYHTGEEEVDELILVDPPSNFCEIEPENKVKSIEETISNSHDMVSSGRDQSTVLLLESVKSENDLMDANTSEEVSPNEPVTNNELVSSLGNVNTCHIIVNQSTKHIENQDATTCNVTNEESTDIDNGNQNNSFEGSYSSRSSESNSERSNDSLPSEDNSCSIIPKERTPAVERTLHSSSDFVLSVDSGVINGSDIQIETTSQTGDSVVFVNDCIIAQELQNLHKISDKNEELAQKITSTSIASSVPSETRKPITSVHNINAEEINGNADTEKKSVHQQKNSNVRYTTIHELRKMFTGSEESSVNSSPIKHSYAASNDLTTQKMLDKRSVGGNTTEHKATNAEMNENPSEVIRLSGPESSENSDALSKFHDYAAQDLTKNWDAPIHTKYSLATPNKEIHLSPSISIKLEVNKHEKANVNQRIPRGSTNEGSNVNKKSVTFDEHHVRFADQVNLHNITKDDSTQLEDEDGDETTDNSLSPDCDTTTHDSKQFLSYGISQLVDESPASCRVIMQSDKTEGKSSDLARTDISIQERGCQKLTEKSIRLAQTNEMQQEHNIVNHPGNDATNNQNKNNPDMQTEEEESCMVENTASARLHTDREGGNQKSVPGTEHQLEQDMCTFKYCIENVDKKEPSEVEKTDNSDDSCRKFILEPEVTDDAKDAVNTTVVNYDLSGDSKSSNSDNSVLESPVSSPTKRSVSESLDETYLMENRPSAPGTQKLVDSSHSRDTSGDMSQSSASTDAEVGNNVYFSKYVLSSDSPQLSSLPEMFVDDDNATLSDISPISDFAPLPQLPTDISTHNCEGQIVSHPIPSNENSMQSSIDNQFNTNIQKFDSFSMGNQDSNLNNLTHDGNWNDEIVISYPRVSNTTDHTRESAIDLQVVESYSVTISPDDDPHYDDDEQSSSDRTHMNTSAESSDNSKLESSVESSLSPQNRNFFTKDDLIDSSIDLTSPTPSQSTCDSSRSQSCQNYALITSGYLTRLPPVGCSGSSEEDEGAEVDSDENCYDSLEDLKKRNGKRKLPIPPPLKTDNRDSLENLEPNEPKSLNVSHQKEVNSLTRSHTFTFNNSVSTNQGKSRRKLPQIPPRAISVSRREDSYSYREFSAERDRDKRAKSVGREINLLRNPAFSCDRRSRLDSGFPFNVDEKKSLETDSGCPSYDPYGEETCVDPPNLLPKRNQSNFLWVDFDESEKSVTRRPKNHDRLVQARKNQNRHSAPPGSLDGDKIQPAKKFSVPERGSTSSSSRSEQQTNHKYSHVKRTQSDKMLGLSSKGRIHSAVVSGINVETKSVTVEWFERGETKGKEIELEQILGLNQDLAPTSYDNANVIPNKLQKYVPRPSLPVANNKAAPAGGGTKRNPGRQSHVVTSNGHNKEQNVENQNGSGPHNNLGNSETLPPPKHVPTLPPEKSETVSKATGAAAAQGVNRRRSNVVKEVERLKENREKRRAQQAQILEEQEQLRNKDPGNPNWEFLQMILDYKDELEFNPLQDGDPTANHQITVCIRKRPMSQKETKKKEVDVVTVPTRDGITIHEPKSKVDLTKYLDNQHFRFDYAFDENANNELVYKYTARSLVQSIFEGGMATCFAYGQTGSGKTHTMGGEFHGKNQDSKNGIYAFATKDVFKLLKSPKYKNNNLLVSCSYFEIYSGKVFDLLSGKSKLRVLEDGKQQVVVVGLTETEVECVEDVLKLITHGNNLRTSGQTSANAHSSRSHAVFQIILRLNNNKKPLYGKFSLIDLAGNERGADTSSANRQTRMEGAEINKSLLALKECIRALGRKGAHLPFRASKLTQVLRDSFIGEKARTCMIAMISPSLSSCEHTLNTLRYADRVKELGSKRPAREGHNGGDMVEYEDDMGDILDDNESGRMEDGVLSPEDSDLAQLRSLNDGECSADWYNFQESVAHLQLLEEEVVESHKNLLDSMEHWIQQDASLLAMTNEVDYDQDAYAQQLEDMISEKQEALEALRDKTRAFRACLNEEEAQSNKMRRN